VSVSLTRQDQSAFFVAGLRATDDLFLSENYDHTNISGDRWREMCSRCRSRGPTATAGPRRLEASVRLQFPHVSTVIADFDEWDAPVGHFDAVVVATAFHWLDPSIRVLKCASVLCPGGTLAIVNTHWGAGAHEDLFVQDSQACYAQWDPGYDPSFRPLRPDDLPRRNEELEEPGLFETVAHRRHFCRREYSARAYCDLLGTFSNFTGFRYAESQWALGLHLRTDRESIRRKHRVRRCSRSMAGANSARRNAAC
jgi:SAM-dependent methyltransferase